MRRLTAILSLLIVLVTVVPFTSVSHGRDVSTAIRIGVLAKRGLNHCNAKWQPTADYLSKMIPPYHFSIVPLDFASVSQAVADKEVDFILTNSSYYIELEDIYGVDAVATLVNRMHCGDHKVFGGVVFTRADQSSINDLKDLGGRDFMAVKETSFGGWRMALREMKAQGIDPSRDFKSLSFGGTHDAVVFAVQNHQVDAGTVRTDTLERMAAENKINMADFRIININEAARDSFRLMCSTRLYPEWPMAKLNHTPKMLAEKVAQALYRLDEKNPAALASRSAGWAYPLSYHQVHDCLKELELGPYDPHGPHSVSGLFRQHRQWFFLGGVSIFVILFSVVCVAKLNTKLSLINTDLLSEIEKRKKSEAGLFESEYRLQTMLDSSIAGVLIIDPQTHTIVDANNSALEMIGSDKVSVVGQNCFGFICPAEKDHCPVTDQGMEFHRAERILLRSDGTQCPILKSVTRFKVDGKTLLLDSFIDISELKESQFHLESALASSNEANQAKDNFLANMSHELRTPMNGIIGMTNILQSTELTDDQAEYAQIIHKSSEGLLTIINDILDFSNIQENTASLEVVDFNLHNLVDSVMATITPEASEKRLTCSQMVADDIPGYLKGDRRRLKKVLRILMSNAVKFTDQGAVSLHLSLDHDEKHHCTIRFMVKDTGIGIEPERIDHIFNPFSQVDNSSTRRYSGTGLGLALAKHFLELMEGQIKVESTPAKGSTFQVSVRLEKQASIPVRKPPRDVNLSHLRILVVDDNTTNRQVLEGFLKSRYLQYAAVENARSAMAALHRAVNLKSPFDVAVIDHMMPEIDGMDLGRTIKGDPILNGVKMILLTSSGQPLDANDLSTIGFDASLAKPVRPTEFFDCLTMVCSPEDGTTNRKNPHHPIITRASISEAQASGPRILVVEDNVINQKVILKILTRHGCRVDVANHGREAVEVLGKTGFDVVLMDIQMPEMNGFEATSAIRNPANKCLDPRVPIIAVTANCMKQDKSKCLEVGMDDYLAKPVNPESLMEKVRQWSKKTCPDLQSHTVVSN